MKVWSKQWVMVALLLLSGTLLFAETEKVEDITQRFWDALIKNDLRTAKALTIRSKIEMPSLLKVRLKEVELKDVRMINGRAFVPTKLLFTLPMDAMKDEECQMEFDTELLQVGQKWLIDEIVTMDNYETALHKGMTACTAKVLKEAVGEGREAYEALKKKFNLFEESMEDKVKGWKDSWKNPFDEMKDELPTLPLPDQGDKI